MKKLLTVLLLFAMTLSIVACGAAQAEAPQEATAPASAPPPPATAVPTEDVRPTEPETEPPIDLANLVTDTYTLSHKFDLGGWEEVLEYRIPRINLDGGAMDRVNGEIYEDIYTNTVSPYVLEAIDTGEMPFCYGVSYDWAVNGDLLSLWITTSLDWGIVQYSVYNISISQKEAVDTAVLLDSCHLTREQYDETTKKALGSFFWDAYGEYLRSEDNEQILEEAQRQLSRTISRENVSAARPYLNEAGELCVAGTVYSMAGGDSYDHLINLTQFELSPYYAETVTGDAVEPEYVISEEDAMEIAKQYWNVTPGDIDEETGYTLSIEPQGTQKIDGRTCYRMALRWLVTGEMTHMSTIDVIYIDAATGDCVSEF